MAWRGWGLLASLGTHWLGTPSPSVPAPDACGHHHTLGRPCPSCTYQDSWVVVFGTLQWTSYPRGVSHEHLVRLSVLLSLPQW